MEADIISPLIAKFELINLNEKITTHRSEIIRNLWWFLGHVNPLCSLDQPQRRRNPLNIVMKQWNKSVFEYSYIPDTTHRKYHRTQGYYTPVCPLILPHFVSVV
ncbi:hypothetical protein JTE90_013613 [Oedothorax gibbosus]|uniref:Uncharacterized protein n=1 Tax=Oedothorax gibbosus TaxID=931172 RepID=A0AAV6UP41_9ARAC|nr:hypothetical protein JTE90_013613 [Oedothorax gibbosus]